MVEAVTDGCWRIDAGNVNVYLVDDGGTLTLVDAGTPGDAGLIRGAVASVGYDLADVERVLLTHYDYDHVGALGRLTPELSAPVYGHEHDIALTTGDRSPPLTKRKGLLQRAIGWRIPDADLRFEPVADGDTVGSFVAYHTPGHSPGHVAFVSETLGVAMVGDLVRESDGRLEPSPWLISYDSTQVRESIRTLADRTGPFEWACPGHGDPVRDGDAALARLA